MFITIYTKKHGRFDLTKEEWCNNFPLYKVTFHRTDGPAIIYYYKNRNVWREYYYINDKRHRIDGPCEIYYCEDGSLKGEFYYIDDENYKKEDYYNLINEIKALPKSLRLTHELWWVREL